MIRRRPPSTLLPYTTVVRSAALHLARLQPGGRLGRWIGYQIVKRYAQEKKKSAAELLASPDDAGEILAESKYNG